MIAFCIEEIYIDFQERWRNISPLRRQKYTEGPFCTSLDRDVSWCSESILSELNRRTLSYHWSVGGCRIEGHYEDPEGPSLGTRLERSNMRLWWTSRRPRFPIPSGKIYWIRCTQGLEWLQREGARRAENPWCLPAARGWAESILRRWETQQ